MSRDRIATLGARRGPGDRAAVEVLRFDSGHRRVLLGPHRHDDLELMYFADGAGTDRLGDQAFDVTSGDILLVTPGIVHDASGLGTARGWAVEFGVGAAAAGPSDDGRAVLQLWWSNPLLTPFVAAGERPAFARFHVPEADRPGWVSRLAAMQAEQHHRREGYDDAIAAYLLITLVELARLAAPFPEGLRQQGHVLLARVFEVIDERFAERLSTVDVAAAVALTPGYLTTLVRQRTGRTVLDWITERRMAEARRLMLGSDLSAEAVARRVGYDDPAYFSRRFRSHHGLSPSRWRVSALGRR
jgi:AraC family transcriptional regulator, transcriptional activator of pobA